MKATKKYGYLWITLVFFLLSIAGHWIFAWSAYVNEQEENNAPIEFKDYFIETSRDTLENWQSEFLQLIWQVCGLSMLLYIGSPQSKESSERTEEKIDRILEKVDSRNAAKIMKDLDRKYPKN
ncbi:MAG TPA: DUF6766 family protein [Alphaproteobacteria bacterium]|nr:DUF6766 family protein [Alphaproteobacteria bacterium]